MTFETDDLAIASATSFAHQLAVTLDQRLEQRFRGAYLLGSLAHGGFSRRYSDLDMALVLDDGLTERELSDFRMAATKLSPAWNARLSIFWSDPNFIVGRFPPLDRVDYLDHAIALVERRQTVPPRPTLGEIRSYLAGKPLQGWVASVRKYAAQSELESNDHKGYLRALLYPARFILSWRTGGMGSNDEAVAYLRALAPTGINIEVVEMALDCRRRAADPVDLWKYRGVLPAHIETCYRICFQSNT